MPEKIRRDSVVIRGSSRGLAVGSTGRLPPPLQERFQRGEVERATQHTGAEIRSPAHGA
jgi:hypothetical protein